MLTRLSHGHIRIGTFQRLAFFKDADGLRALTAYCLAHLYGEAGDDPARLLALVCERTAALAASYLAAGFVHGVLNSDNIAITGESFDYGPWRFAPEWDEEFVAAYFDHHGLYAFGRQPEAIHWDVAQLAGALSLIADHAPLQEALDRWPGQFERALVRALLRRLGVEEVSEENDSRLVGALLAALRTRATTIDRLFFDWRGGRVPDDHAEPAFAALANHLDGRRSVASARDHPYWSDAGPCSMHIHEVEAIWARIAEADDWAPFEEKVAAIRRMGQAMTAGAMTPPCAGAGEAPRLTAGAGPEDQ